jgi:hypothetical protein
MHQWGEKTSTLGGKIPFFQTNKKALQRGLSLQHN